MKIENLMVPDGCQAGGIGQTQFMPTGHYRTVMTAVCGDRKVESLAEPTAQDITPHTPEHDAAFREAHDELAYLVAKMCQGCPNRTTAEATTASEPMTAEDTSAEPRPRPKSRKSPLQPLVQVILPTAPTEA